MRDFIFIYINKKRYEIKGKWVFAFLADFLRDHLLLTGTKEVCREGDCGACSVLLLDTQTNNFIPINSCITPLYLLDSAQIVTIEGLTAPNIVQEKIISHYALQCGFCAPGIVLVLTSFLDKKRDDKLLHLNRSKIVNHLTGNLCRCSGYQKIIEAILTLDGEPATPLLDDFRKKEVILELKREQGVPLEICFEDNYLYAPVQLSDALTKLEENKDLKIVAGGTENKSISKILILQKIQELNEINFDDGEIKIGSMVTISKFRKFIKDKIPHLSNLLNVFASPQIKNRATVVGNMANGSPVADIGPFLNLVKASVEITNSTSLREIDIADLFIGYKKSTLQEGELIKSIKLALPPNEAILKLYKVSQRKDLDIASVNAGFLLSLDNDQSVKSIELAYGGVKEKTILLKKSKEFLSGKAFNLENINKAKKLIEDEISPISDLRGSKEYRLDAALNLFMKFYYQVMEDEKTNRL